MNRNPNDRPNLDPHDVPTLDLNDPANQGADLQVDDALPDIPAADPNSQPISSPDPIDFSTKGITGAGSVGMSTFNDGDQQSFFERTADAFGASGIESPMLGNQAAQESTRVDEVTSPQRRHHVRIYGE